MSTRLGSKRRRALLTTSFYWDTDDKTREWSNRFFAKINRVPTIWQAGVYSSVMHYLKAIQTAGTDEPARVAAKMRDMPVEDFFAHNGHLREDGLMVHDLMLVQVKKPEDSRYPSDYYQILTRIPRRTSVRPAQSGLSAGQRMSADRAIAQRNFRRSR
jgi:branched-chain amino acid transport system substrate-binding protein